MSILDEDGRAALGMSGAPSDDVLGLGSIVESDTAARRRLRQPLFKPELLEAYRGTGHELIPLHAPHAQDANGRPIGKAPFKGWRQHAPLLVEEAQAHMREGGNIGVRLRPRDLVVDVDPRNFAEGDNPFARLQQDLSFDFRDYPTVVTGSGGFHVYMLKPEYEQLRDSLDAYQGVEFKTLGRQVVAAGSVHPNALKPYVWTDDALAPMLYEAGSAPDSLIELTRRPLATVGHLGGGYTPEQLEAMLGGLEVTDYSDQGRWLELMMACHHASGGYGREEFIAWSTGDPTYREQAHVIGRRWDSLHADAAGRRVTCRTLFKALHDAGRAELIPRQSAEEDFPDVARIEGGVTMDPRHRGVLDEWVYVIDAEMFVRREDCKKWKKEQWKARYASLKPDGDVLSAIWKGSVPIRKFEALVYLPGDAEFPDGEEGGRYNIWRESGIQAKAGDVAPFLTHMAYLFPDDTEREHVFDYLAMLVQKPGCKVNYALLIKGDQGTGKSWIGRLMTKIIGLPNVVFPSNSEVLSNWTAWTEGAQLAVIEELMAMGRLDMANRLKPIITEPFLRIEAKNCNLYTIPNRLNLIAFTNHEDSVPIERGDRRWLVAFSAAKPLDDGYYDGIFSFLEGEGPAAVKDWLLRREVRLKAKGTAPATAGKEVMRRLSLGEAEQFLVEQFEEGAPPFASGLFRFEDVVASLPSDIAARSKGLRDRVLRWLRDGAGAVKHSRYTKQDGSGRVNSALWSLRDHADWERAGAAARADAYAQRRTPDWSEAG